MSFIGAVRTVRVRGIKYKLSGYTAEQLDDMLHTATVQRDEMERLRQAVEAELSHRSGQVQGALFHGNLTRRR